MDAKLNRFASCVFLKKTNLTRRPALQMCKYIIEIAHASLFNVLCEFEISPYLLDVQFIRPLHIIKEYLA